MRDRGELSALIISYYELRIKAGEEKFLFARPRPVACHSHVHRKAEM